MKLKHLFATKTLMENKAPNKDLSSYYKASPIEQWWDDIKLTKGFTSLEKVNLKKASLVEILSKLGADLNFLEHIEIASLMKDYLKGFNSDEYFKCCGFTNSPYLIKAINLVSKMPDSFLTWAKEKSLAPKDFRIFYGVTLDEEVLNFCKKVVALKPSKSEGVLIFEYGLDLMSSNQFDESLYSFKKSDSFLKAIKKKRFYKTMNSDEKVSNKIAKLDFGSESRVKTLREGDKRLLHLEIKSSHPLKLKKSLQRVTDNISKLEDAWI